MRFYLLIWAWGCSVPALTGCSTVLGMADSEDEHHKSKIFVGTRVAIRGIEHGLGELPECVKICFFHDLLPSVAADIALLPVTLVYELFRPKAALPPPKPPGQEQRKDRRRKGRRRRFS